jgi:catechol 2,3-dioxygenase-like lactoylglutathione lyase family enzyme
MMNSQIRYLAMVSERPDTLANFNSKYFKMRELGRSDAGDVGVTDGFYNISILKRRDRAEELGINHFGVTIDDIGEVEERLKEFASGSDIRQEEGGLFHGDYRLTDPSGQSVTLSTHEFHTPKVERTFPCIRHLAICVPNNDEVLDFYVNVFGFRESTTSKKIRAQNRVVRWAADGDTAMAILPDRNHRDMNERESPRDGLNHFGWLVNDIGPVFRFAARRLRQPTTVEPAHGRIPRLRSGSQPLRYLPGQGL